MGSQNPAPVVLVHADESCLGNQNKGPSKGGASALLEISNGAGIIRNDFYLSSPDTTNNRMALLGASKLLTRLRREFGKCELTYYSDSQYLVKGMNEWIHSWKAKGWRRRGGSIENLELWQLLDQAARHHTLTFRWVRGHAGNPKNEYADRVAVRAAEGQEQSDGLVKSGWGDWILEQNERGVFRDFNADDHFREITGTGRRR